MQGAERSKVVGKLGGWHMSGLAELLDMFDLPRPSEGNKEHKIERIVEFLEKPHKASDKDLAALVSPRCLGSGGGADASAAGGDIAAGSSYV